MTAIGQDLEMLMAFQNFLSWGEAPYPDVRAPWHRKVPPAWWAYALGYTQWCPPKGEM